MLLPPYSHVISTPLITGELLQLSLVVGGVVVLAHFQPAEEVASYRAVFNPSRLNTAVLGAFVPLFLPLAVAAGLFVGKQLGIFGAVWLSVRLGLAGKLRGATWLQIYGVATLCGIGFTMSLFIGALAFPEHPELAEEAKIGTLEGSFLSAVVGYLILRLAPSHPQLREEEAEIDAEIDADGATCMEDEISR